MAEALSQGTYIRIKRRLEVEPLDEIIISSKKPCFGLKTNAATSSDLTVFKRVDSIQIQANSVENAKKILSHRKNNLKELKVCYKKGFRDTIKQTLKDGVKAASAENRYTLTAYKRRMDDGTGSLLNFKIFETQLDDGTNLNNAVSSKMEEVLSGSAEVECPMIYERDGQAITCNGEEMTTNQTSCYDIFYCDESPKLLDIFGQILEITDYKVDCKEDTSITEDSSDLEVEDHCRNMYPEDRELSSDSNDEDMTSRLRRLGIVDSCSDFSSCDSSDDEEHSHLNSRLFEMSQSYKMFHP